MRIRIAVPEEHVEPDVVNAALEAVTRLDEHLIRSGQSPTSHELLAGGAIWRPENMGDEHFDHGGTIAQRGWGDCDDWAPIHAATLRASGEDPHATAIVVPSGPSTYHAIVQRGDGTIDDPSIAAGMRPPQRVSGSDAMEVYACDPHDGRIYQGSLTPAVGPLSIHCGVGFSARGTNGCYEGRCDVPIVGSPLLSVVGHHRRHRKHRHRTHGVVHVVGALPYALSVTARGSNPGVALSRAIVGAIMCGDAAQVPPNLDKYKLLAVQAAMAGASPGQVREALVTQITNDVQSHAQATNTHPLEHTQALLEQLTAETGDHHGSIAGCEVVDYDGRTGIVGYVVGDFFSDIGHIASGVVSAVSHVASDVAKVVSNAMPVFGDIVHGVEAAVSVVPGLGTAISDVVAAAETAYDAAAAALSGHPILGAIDAAYNFALSNIPGGAALHVVLDPVKSTLENLAIKGEPIESAALDGILQAVPNSPDIGGVNPRSIASSIAHVVVGHLGMKNTGKGKPLPAGTPTNPTVAAAKAKAKPVPKVDPKAHAAAMAKMAAQAKTRAAKAATAPRPVINLKGLAPPAHPALANKPAGEAHASLHVALAPAVKSPVAEPPPPGSPGAPPGATMWTCVTKNGVSQCRWV